MSDLALTMLVIGIVVVVSVVFGCSLEAFKAWSKHRIAMAQALGSDAAERAAQYAARNERLEQRVAVLERIATDRSALIADEIETLRDKPLN